MYSNAAGMLGIADHISETVHCTARSIIGEDAEPSHAREARSSKQLVSILKSQLALLLISNLSDYARD